MTLNFRAFEGGSPQSLAEESSLFPTKKLNFSVFGEPFDLKTERKRKFEEDIKIQARRSKEAQKEVEFLNSPLGIISFDLKNLPGAAFESAKGLAREIFTR